MNELFICVWLILCHVFYSCVSLDLQISLVLIESDDVSSFSPSRHMRLLLALLFLCKEQKTRLWPAICTDSLSLPLFQKYVENVKQDASIGTNILRVSASDEDADNNGAIVYSLTAPVNPNDLEYFEIQAESGWIVLKKPLDVSVLVCLLLISRSVLRDLHCSHLRIPPSDSLYLILLALYLLLITCPRSATTLLQKNNGNS